MDTQVRITLHRSRTYFVLLSVLALTLVLVISVLPMPAGWRWLGYLAVLVITSSLLRRDVLLLSGQSCLSLVCDKNREVSFVMRNGEQPTGRLCADTLVTPWLVLILTEVAGRGGRSVLLFPDAMPAEDFRRLRVLLRNSAEHQS